MVINGSLSAASLLVSDGAVSAVIGWSGLRVGDGARDLHWLLAARGEAAESAIAAYTAGRGSAADAQFTRRAMLYAELELARWLLHGVETRDQGVVDDAVAMLDGLVDSVHSDVMNPITPATAPVMAVADVEAMLGETPQTQPRRDSGAALQTDSYDISRFDLDFADEHDAEAGGTSGPRADAPQRADRAPSAPSTGGSSDDTLTGPIELFDMPEDDVTDDQSSRQLLLVVEPLRADDDVIGHEVEHGVDG